jgi:hypothetical protein
MERPKSSAPHQSRRENNNQISKSNRPETAKTDKSQRTSSPKHQESCVPKPPLDDGVRRAKSATSHGHLLQSQAPIVKAIKPRNLTGPFDLYDVPIIRETIEKRYARDAYRRSINMRVSNQFYDDLKLDKYFLNEKNWKSKPKFANTRSLHSAVSVYLPEIRKSSLKQSMDKYRQYQIEKINNGYKRNEKNDISKDKKMYYFNC